MNLPTLRVLVIDDELWVRNVLRDYLLFMGHQVDTANDGDAGVALFERDRHDAVITDLMMPGLSGWGVVERVRGLDPRTRVIIVTGAATGGEVERARGANVLLLHKPVRLADLAAAVTPASDRE